MGTGITLESGGALKVINNVVKIVASNTTNRNLSQLGRSGVKFVRIGSCELVSLGAVV